MTVNHGILLKKFEHYRIRDNMLDWFQSYLSDHKQYVDINGKSFDLYTRYYLWCSSGICPWTIAIFYIYK